MATLRVTMPPTNALLDDAMVGLEPLYESNMWVKRPTLQARESRKGS